MRKLLQGVVVAAVVLAPVVAMADNQETANDIAKNLRENAQLSDYKIGVKYQDGAAWLRGHVRSQAQLAAALKTASGTAGVTHVINDLEVVPAQANAAAAPPAQRPSAAKRLEAVRVTADQLQLEPSQPPMPQSRMPQLASGRRSNSAKRVASTFNTAPAQQASLDRSAPMAMQPSPRVAMARPQGRPLPVAYTQQNGAAAPGGPIPAYVPRAGGGVAPARYDQPNLPNYSWPSYAPYPNYAGLTYPRQYSPTAWPFIGPFYPYPQVPLGWRKVTLEWDDGWWMLDFKDH